jgi:hypothetical protein
MSRGRVGVASLAVSGGRPSGASSAIVILSAIGVAAIIAWVLAPMLMAKYPTRVAAVPPVLVSAPAAAVAPADPSTIVAAANPAAARASAEEEPPALPDPVTASTVPSAIGLTPASWPAPPAPTVQTASADPASALLDSAQSVPLPRKRPGLTIARQLVVPLPRPRPELEDAAPAPDLSAFERQVQRMR